MMERTMDRVGFSIYARHLLGDKSILAEYEIQGVEPEHVFPQLIDGVRTLVKVANEASGKSHGGVIHMCGLTGLMGNDFVRKPWLDAVARADLGNEWSLGFHVNFDHQNLPLAPGFTSTYENAMHLCKLLNVEAMVLHAPLVKTTNTDQDWIDLMTSEGILDITRSTSTVLCWENAQDSIARYRLLENLIEWREQLVNELERTGNGDLADRHQFCFDTGHFLLSLQRDDAPREELDNFLPEFAKHVKVYHIHANDGTSDQHLVPFIDVEKTRGTMKFPVHATKFQENSELVLSMIETCQERSLLHDRHLHMEVDSPSSIDDMAKFYKRYYQ